MHLKRRNINKFWPIPKKGTKYVAVPLHNQNDSIPLVLAIRDILKIVKTSKELKKLINEKQILVNNKIVMETNFPISLFDVISLPLIKKYYRSSISKDKKIILDEITEKESNKKVYKIINKKILGNKKIQLNLMFGRNILTNEKANTGDSVIFDLKENKIVKIIPLEKGREAFVIKGKHAGESGKINDIIERGGKKLAKISSEKEKLNVWVKNIIVIE